MIDYSLSKPYLPSKNSLFPPRVTFLAVGEFHARSLIRSVFYPWAKTGTTRSRMGTLHSKKSLFPQVSRARLIRSFLLSLSREKWGNTQFAARQRKLPVKIMYAFCCSPAWQFCTTWMATGKGPIRRRIGTFIHMSPFARARSSISRENEDLLVVYTINSTVMAVRLIHLSRETRNHKLDDDTFSLF